MLVFLGPGKSLQDAFEAVSIVNRTPRDAAMFAEHDAVYRRYIYYFSPGAYSIAGALIDSNARHYMPTPCKLRSFGTSRWSYWEHQNLICWESTTRVEYEGCPVMQL